MHTHPVEVVVWSKPALVLQDHYHPKLKTK